MQAFDHDLHGRMMSAARRRAVELHHQAVDDFWRAVVRALRRGGQTLRAAWVRRKGPFQAK